MKPAMGALASSLVWSKSAGWVAVGPSRGVARVYRASACSDTPTFEVLCGASCGD
jgi:hypothetical protein